MSTILKWRQPKEAAERDWQEALAQLRLLLRLWLKWLGIVLPLFLFAIYRLSPGDTMPIAKRLPAIVFLIPVAFYLLIKVDRLIGNQYEIGESRFSSRSGASNSVFYTWQGIEAFCITSDPEFPDLRVWEFKTKRSKKWCKWNFDPSIVDENALSSVLDKHLPGKRQGTGEISRPPGY